MGETVTMPQLGESVVEGTIAKWLKQPGDPVARYEMIVSVVTDKVDAEIPSPAEGTMGEVIAPEGAVVAVGDPICVIETVGGLAIAPPAPASEGARVPQPAPAAAETPALAPAPAAAEPARAPGGAPQPPARVNGELRGADGRRLHLTPAVKMLAREHGVDLLDVAGTGFGGRITKKDVLDHVQRRNAAGATATMPAPSIPSAPSVPLPPAPAAPGAPGEDTLVPLTPVRRAIAEHMVRSRQTSPHAWVMMEVDMTRVVQLRSSQREDFRRRHGVALTFLPFVARAVLEGLRRFPTLNATWTEQGVLLKHDLNLGIAIALEDKLIVPVIRNADRLTVTGLATAMADLADRARTKRMSPDELQGGTFTLNNTGSLGTVLSQAIINQPQAAILAMDAVVKRPVVVADDAIAVRSMMNLCLSFDHRINDGLSATRFLKAVKELLEATDPAAGLS